MFYGIRINKKTNEYEVIENDSHEELLLEGCFCVGPVRSAIDEVRFQLSKFPEKVPYDDTEYRKIGYHQIKQTLLYR